MKTYNVNGTKYAEIDKQTASGRRPWYRASLKGLEHFLRTNYAEPELIGMLSLANRNATRKIRRALNALGVIMGKEVRKTFTIASIGTSEKESACYPLLPIDESVTTFTISSGSGLEIGDQITFMVTEYSRWERFWMNVRFHWMCRVYYPVKRLIWRSHE